MSSRAPWLQALLIGRKLTPEQADQLEETIRRTAVIMQAAIDDVAYAVRNIVYAMEDSPDLKELALQFSQASANENLPAHKYERPRLPSEQGYRRTPYDCWRAGLGKRKGKRKL